MVYTNLYTIPMKNPDRLRAHLKKLGMSMNKCARMLGVADLSVYRYCADLREPTKEIRKKMKRKLGFEWGGK